MQRNDANLELIGRRHPEWREHQLRWRWMLDSLEGGERYRNAIYGYDRRGLPARNLVRHKREYPDPREQGGMPAFDPADSASCVTTDDDYELRRARTPVPTFVAEAVQTHLARIFAREVTRDGPDLLLEWWRDVDGCGTTLDHWMGETIAPLLLTLGQIDLFMDHPASADGETVETEADVKRLGLGRCIAGFILPEDMLWWRLDEAGNAYAECLVREHREGDEGTATYYRHWDDQGSTLYDGDGNEVDSTAHRFGRVPMIRVFDARKPRCRNIGQSRYEGIAERQREYYNRDSELILSDTTQAHPLLQGPEDFIQPDGTIPIGPSWLLPKKKNTQGNTATYEGFDVVDFPKDGAESIRRNKADLRDDVDRDSALVRPTGRDGLAQSGLSKMFDHCDGNNRLAKIAKILQRCEEAASTLAQVVIGGAAAGDFAIHYPADFDLFTAGDVATSTAEFQSIAGRAGALPGIERRMLSRLAKLCLPGLADEQYAAFDAEIAEYLAAKAKVPVADRVIVEDVHRWGSTN